MHRFDTSFTVGCLALAIICPAAFAQPSNPDASPEPLEIRIPGTEEIQEPWLRALLGGKFDLNMRWRYEFADITGFDEAHALTMRTRFGYTTGEFAGFSAAAQMENNLAADDDAFNAAGLNGQPDESVIADPEDTELNQFWLNFDARAMDRNLPVSVRAGRQRIILDDARFAGNVGWRQLEQTYDAVRLQIDPAEQVHLDYSYVWDVRRIFGPDADRDFESDSHLINVSYGGLSLGKLTGFAYLLDLDNAGGAGLSSQTYGVRLAGKHPLDEGLDLHYVGSAAIQSDYGDNPTSYDALYLRCEVKLAASDGLFVGGGFEQLGSDDSRIAFSTPLATLHKFNGFADAFLATPAGGLRDTYAFVGTKLPEPMNGKFVLTGHHFSGDDSGGELGWEIDAVATHQFDEHLALLTKVAHFEGENQADITRFWLQLTLTF